MSNKFPTSQVLYKSTYGADGITVRNIQLECDKEGFIEGPADLEEEIKPHGFIRAEKWFDSLSQEEKLKTAAKYEYFLSRLGTADRAKATSLRKQEKATA